ncbi:MAG: hypothetical protein HQK72_02065 [Desulfamplus sp.]|nr:hypothetical protein [Desulfamplus sp.]
MSNFVSLIIGIVSSLVATAVFIVLSEFFRRIVLPWYEDKIYRGVRIDGEWRIKSVDGKAVDPKDATLTSKFTLHQKGEKVMGQYFHGGVDEKDEVYLVTGHIRDGYLSLISEPKSRRSIDAGVGLYHIRYDGSKLQLLGALTYIVNHGEVETQKMMCYELQVA